MLVVVQILLGLHFFPKSVPMNGDRLAASSRSLLTFLLVVLAISQLIMVGVYRELLPRRVSGLSARISFLAVAWVSAHSGRALGCVLELVGLGLAFRPAAASLAGRRLLHDVDIKFYISSAYVGMTGCCPRLSLGLGFFQLELHILIWAEIGCVSRRFYEDKTSSDLLTKGDNQNFEPTYMPPFA